MWRSGWGWWPYRRLRWRRARPCSAGPWWRSARWWREGGRPCRAADPAPQQKECLGRRRPRLSYWSITARSPRKCSDELLPSPVQEHTELWHNSKQKFDWLLSLKPDSVWLLMVFILEMCFSIRFHLLWLDHIVKICLSMEKIKFGSTTVAHTCLMFSARNTK